jgi:alkanesulfonate monooxygenase SsuD/methylene tetrahydromethanopterin reductase-like flavin-dependent oxidoreductase (luciferase family)
MLRPMQSPARTLGFGITAGERPWLAALARRVEQLGYGELWANDSGGRSGLSTLQSASNGTWALDLGVGVIALSERDPASIAAEALGLALPRRRLIAGIGSGRSRSLDLVRAGAAELRRSLPGVRLAVAAVGPRMCRLAGEVADVVLLNWATPARIERQRALVAEGAERAGRAQPRIAAYVRAALGADAAERLRDEQRRYAGYGIGYRRALEEQEGEPVGVAAADAAELRPQLAAYRAVLDSCIVRGLPASDELDEWTAIAEAAA